ncbi:NADPH-dependent FMN reductase [Rhodobacter capsulatus]|jgi:chromate reductase|uniref:NAD(P)H dehydrogenase (Quinone) n=1 Tax=Rhodobacter capsulatus (strain ATCC BAA-309 / NBRC 16581 / SB1003) TaxID=272942 RepID=D5AL27_RHOCB|nr:NAD(P)H-dependent oxidoreductase [Rhodobacter capsulatus]ADE86017.1 NAD(P)H dehydrogenase (quinone) [Rhodobacter capsulatus SB 1003]ETD01111.1 ACP phosphodiesterase [Rhodobacter capsulatus DE442]ETD75696.1 ACP phosphodiesterase [Rhodobacter capsulatus R121]ETE53328.1 ACP phosphodiesterase [Rhodobacter capsulatus Y262]MDS0926867.1 NAD(P)H-dependent oxidoreductase [Rhodobacter capsulatus]
MSPPHDIAVIVGSIRKGSLTRQLAEALIALAPESLRLRLVEIGDLALFNPDLDEGTPPESWTHFRAAIASADGILFVTPEHNRSIPAALKNALDIGSRPWGKNHWAGKPAAVVSGSPGALGGFGANHQLRQILVVLDMPAMAQPEAYLGHLGQAFDAGGNLTEDRTRAHLQAVMQAFAGWVARQAA